MKILTAILFVFMSFTSLAQIVTTDTANAIHQKSYCSKKTTATHKPAKKNIAKKILQILSKLLKVFKLITDLFRAKPSLQNFKII